jgi:hypothetical protein
MRGFCSRLVRWCVVAKKVTKKKTTKKKIPKGIAPLDASVDRKGLPYEKLRVEAMAVYVMDMNGATVEDLAKDPRFKDLSISTLRSWSAEDGWNALRKEAIEKVREKLQTELKFRLSDNILREVRDLMELRDLAWTWLKATPPKSLEGMLKAFMDINKRLGEIADLVRQGILDDTGKRVETSTGSRVKADPKELVEISKMLTAKKRAALRARLAKEKKADEVDQAGPEH